LPIDLSNKNAEGPCTFGALKIRRERETEDRMLYDLDLVFDVENREHAQSIERFLPGTVAMYIAAGEGPGPDGGQGKDRRARRPTTINWDVELADEESGSSFVRAPAEVTNCVFTVVKDAATLLVKVRLYGLTAEIVGSLARYLGRRVTAIFQAKQETIPFPNAKVSTAPTPEVGDIVSGADEEGEFVGLVTAIGADGTMTLDDFGHETTAPLSAVAGVVKVGELPKGLDKYLKAAKKVNRDASWIDLLPIVAELGAVGDGYKVTGAVIDEAVRRVKALGGDVSPPAISEAG
jgi:hypothetical protein